MSTDEPTCGKGLAEHSALPAKIGAVIGAIGEVLELHMTALDLTDERSRREHDAYRELADVHRHIASQLQATARRMAGYRDLPMGRHDMSVMASPKAAEVFAQVVKLEGELLSLLQSRVERDRAMLGEMRAE
jgi:hypothetical protein